MSHNMLIIDPAYELRFCGPFTRPVVTVMTLTNTSDQIMLFKIKTTAPKRYCVRPNIGGIQPYKSTSVEICLQPFVYDANEKNKHKFMVQSVLVPESADLSDLNKLWKELEPDQLMDAKLKCVFEMPPVGAPTGAASAPADVDGGDRWLSGENADDKEELVKKDDKKLSNIVSSDQAESLLDEVRNLREDNSSLRKDNIILKEQVFVLRSTQAKSPINEPYAPVMAEKQIPMFYIAITIAATILGLLLGKYLL